MPTAGSVWADVVNWLTGNAMLSGAPGGAVAAGVDAVLAAVLAVAGPGDHEVAGRVRRHRRAALGVGGDGVDLELAPQRRPGGAVAAGVDAGAAAVLAKLDQAMTKSPAASRHRRLILTAGGELVDWNSPPCGTPAELKALGEDASPEPSWRP